MLEKKTFQLRDVKAADDTPGQFSGRASVYGVLDFHGDVVMPGAFTKSLEENGNDIVVLSQHDSGDSIGRALLTDQADALYAAGQLVLDLDSAKQAYIRVKNKLVTGISIGYETVGEKFVNGVRQLTELKLWEISLVTFPANSFARVIDVKDASTWNIEGLADKNVEQIISRLVWLGEEAKAGRMLSATNRQKLADALEAMGVAGGHVEDVIAAAENDEKQQRELLDGIKNLAKTAASFITR